MGVAQGMAFADLDNDGDLDVVVNCLHEPARIFRNDSTAPRLAVRRQGPPPAALVPLFEDVSSRLQHVHQDEPFDDFAHQTLLPRRLSTLGPGVAWLDLDGDGREDLLVNGGKAGRAAAFRNCGGSNFVAWSNITLPQANARDQTAVVAWRGSKGVMHVISGESNWEDGDGQAPAFRVLEWPLESITPGPSPTTDVRAPIPSGSAATGPLALADVDGDGHLDLFVGGRAVAKRYPEPASSHLFANHGHGFSARQSFPGAGMVSGAVFTDLTGDGAPDLVLGCDWDALRIYRNEGGRLAEWDIPLQWPGSNPAMTRPRHLSELTGWWNGVAAGDFDGDGRLDLAASNWGRNWRTDQPPGTQIPVHLYYGDFTGDGTVQTLLASYDPFLSIGHRGASLPPCTRRSRQ